MKTMFELSVYEIVGSSLCVAASDGQKVYERLKAGLNEDKSVSLSFRNVCALTSAFLNTAIGQLYGEFTEEKVRTLLALEEIDADDRELVRRVVETAKLYFKDKNYVNRVIDEERGV